MPIERIGKFLESSDLVGTHSLGIETSQLKRCIREIRRRKIVGVFGCPAFGFKQDDLDFLNDVPLISQVWFWEINLKNIDGLYSLSELEYFGVHEKRPAIDFSRFPQLQQAVWHPVRNDRGLGGLRNLERLDVWRFKPKDKSYDSIELPGSLKRLDLNWCNPTSLSGMPILEALEELQIHYCRNLESIDSIFELAPNLKKLVITRCANLEDYDVALSRDLEHVYINVKGKEVISKTRQADDLSTSGV